MKKQVKPTAEMIAAASKVFALRAQIETIRPIVEAIKTRVLDEINATDDDGNRVSLSDYYMMSDACFAEFDACTHREYIAEGFNVEQGYCPLAMTETAEADARRELLKASESFWQQGPEDLHGLTYERLRFHPTICTKVTETTLGYVAKFIKK